VPTFPARLVTPEQVLLEEDVAAVILRTDVGDATFLPGHTRLIGAIVPGPVRFQREDGTEEIAAVHGGFVQVDPGHVAVLAPVAELAADIDLDRARRALQAAGDDQPELDRGDHEGGAQSATGAAAARRRAEVRIEVAEGAGRPG